MTYCIVLDYYITKGLKTGCPIFHIARNTNIVEDEEVVLFKLEE